ncbi:MAG: site-specific integrase [Cyanobacteria bacterium P01_A01_bin.17]
MVKVQRVMLAPSEPTWVVLDDDYQLVAPIQDYFDYLRSLDRSPNTIRTRAYHLRLYWDYLLRNHLDWTQVGLSELAEFMLWLRTDPAHNTTAEPEATTHRSEASINGILSAVCLFYDFHEKAGHVEHIPLYQTTTQPTANYKGFLHHITKGKPT